MVLMTIVVDLHNGSKQQATRVRCKELLLLIDSFLKVPASPDGATFLCPEDKCIWLAAIQWEA
jgi:hypothetical protein